jgi:transcription elongation factor Elf1
VLLTIDLSQRVGETCVRCGSINRKSSVQLQDNTGTHRVSCRTCGKKLGKAILSLKPLVKGERLMVTAAPA